MQYYPEHTQMNHLLSNKGRSADERSCIWVEKGHFYGMGFLSFEEGYSEPKELKDSLTRYHSNQYIIDLIHAFIGKYPSKVKRLELFTKERT